MQHRRKIALRKPRVSTTDAEIVALVRVLRVLKKLPSERHKLWALGMVANSLGLVKEAAEISRVLVERYQEALLRPQT